MSADDLTDRLRTWADLDAIEARAVLNADLRAAAARIEELEAENERLREALEIGGRPGDQFFDHSNWAVES